MLLAAVLAPFVLAVFAPAVRRVAGPATGWLLALLPAALTVYFAGFPGPIAAGDPISFSVPWVPTLGIHLSFHVDGLSVMFALLISGIGTFIVLYAATYLSGHADLGRFLMFILMFMGSMLGLVLADNVVTLFVFWELTSITSFLLIGFNHKSARSRRAALQALVVTGGGGLALLAGLLLMAQAGGAMELSTLLQSGDLLRDHPHYISILILVLIGAFTKSAQVPFHFWLPNAMEAPTPVSAYLHSATMVKAGVYLLARVHPGLGGTEVWQITLVAFGATTFLIGAILALRNTDLKLMLAQTTVASLGLLVFLIGLGHELALEAAMVYLFAHAMFKGALFMAAGCIDHGTGTRDVWKLSGLRSAMPITFGAAALAALSMSGLPPFIGFIAKEFVYKGTLGEFWPLLVTGIAIVGNALMFAVAFLVGFKPFLGAPLQSPKPAHEGGPGLWLGPLTLAVLGLLAGLFAGVPETYLVGPAVWAVAGSQVPVYLYLWGGFKTPLLLSMVTIALGALLLWKARALSRAMAAALDRLWGPDQGYDQFLDALIGIARAVTAKLQTGTLRHYLLVTMTVVATILVAPMIAMGDLSVSVTLPRTDFYIWGIALLALAGGFAIAIARSRLIAILSMGVLGMAVALIFVLFSAPDLAFTQLMVETLSVVILALVITRLPIYRSDWRGWPRAIRDSAIAVVVGVGFTLLLLTITGRPLDPVLSEFFAARSYTEAYGRNIVNVILVDFRALDTFGEIAVVVIAGVAVLSLLAMGGRRPDRTATTTAPAAASVRRGPGANDEEDAR
ncbi:MAG: putative monovalent cation/H+ antiporter subunit A [Rhodospirillales bacterium]|nr:putative monovalent cation/H+ antiporter subunit A [Rhodospirillales bacterium]